MVENQQKFKRVPCFNYLWSRRGKTSLIMKYHISHLITLSIKYVIGKNTHPQPKLKGRSHEYIISNIINIGRQKAKKHHWIVRYMLQLTTLVHQRRFYNNTYRLYNSNKIRRGEENSVQAWTSEIHLVDFLCQNSTNKVAIRPLLVITSEVLTKERTQLAIHFQICRLFLSMEICQQIKVLLFFRWGNSKEFIERRNAKIEAKMFLF